MSSSSHRKGHGSSSGSGSSRPHKKARNSHKSIKQLIESLQTHRVNTLTELCRIEGVAATCDNEEDAQLFQEPMTAAWNHYVTSNQFLTELRGLTPQFPFSGDVVTDALQRVYEDPLSNRSWNLAWLCLSKMVDDNLVAGYAAAEAAKPEMWAEHEPTQAEYAQLTQHFEYEWMAAITAMLRHWPVPPTSY